VQVHGGGLSKLAKGTSRRILARKEHRGDEINPCAPPPAGSGVLRTCGWREGVVIHIRLAIRQAVATCSAGPNWGTHHSSARTNAPPGCGLSPPAYSTGDILQIVGSSSNYSLKVLKFHCILSRERWPVPICDTFGWGKSLFKVTCRRGLAPRTEANRLIFIDFS
jgi:hypothetical protein